MLYRGTRPDLIRIPAAAILMAGCLALALAAAGCQRRLATGPVLPERSSATTETRTAAGHPPPAQLWAGLAKTGCFGSCPVFEVQIFDDGLVVWKGIRNVKRLGRFEALAGPEWRSALLEAADAAGFFQLEPFYPRQAAPVPDLPHTVIFLTDGLRQHRVVDNADAPLELQRLERWFVEKLEELEWR